MRLLHTSDWHLGRTLHRADLSAAQAGVVDHLVEVVARERVNVVLVAGDVFDRAVPPVEAVALYDEALVRLRGAGARVVVTSGNHDSAARLGAGARLVEAAGVHVRTRPQEVARPVLLADEHGPVAVYGLPYLEPEAVRGVLPDDPAVLPGDPAGRPDGPRGHAGVLGRALDCVRADLAARGGRSVVLAHAWVAGGTGSDSEREVAVGGVGHVPAGLFAGVDYVALGHLHGPQVLADGLRYSGSPLAYSFSEAQHRKGSWLVELGPGGLSRVEQVPAPVPRRLSVREGTLEQLLVAAEHADVEQDWLSVVLTDPVRPEDAMARLRSRFPHVLVLEWRPAGPAPDGRSYGARVSGRDHLTVALDFVRHVRTAGSGSAAGAAGEAERALLCEALESARRSADPGDARPPGRAGDLAAGRSPVPAGVAS